MTEIRSRSAERLRDLFQQQGFLSALPVLSAEELQEARRYFALLEEQFGEYRVSLSIGSRVNALSQGSVIIDQGHVDGPEYSSYNLHNVHLKYEWVKALTLHPRVLDVVTAVLGPDVILLDSRFICKYPSATCKEQQPYVAWHQDMRYWGIDGGPVLSVWLALDHSLKENGALQVIPGTHRSGMLPHGAAKRPGNMLTVNQEIPEELLQVEQAELCPLLAGQMSLHDGLLVHASEPNTSPKRRCGFVIRYVPTCAHPAQDPDRPRKFSAAVLACGTDRFNHFSNSNN